MWKDIQTVTLKATVSNMEGSLDAFHISQGGVWNFTKNSESLIKGNVINISIDISYMKRIMLSSALDFGYLYMIRFWWREWAKVTRVTSGQQHVPAGVPLVPSCPGAVCESTLAGEPGSLGRLHVTAVLRLQARGRLCVSKNLTWVKLLRFWCPLFARPSQPVLTRPSLINFPPLLPLFFHETSWFLSAYVHAVSDFTCSSSFPL